jgi:hypothetical protein
MLFIADTGGISETQVLFLKETLNEENLSIDVTYHILWHNVTGSITVLIMTVEHSVNS